MPLEEAIACNKRWDELEAKLMEDIFGFKQTTSIMQEKPILPMSDEAGPTPNKEVSEYLKGLKELKPGALHIGGHIEPVELHVTKKLVNESYSTEQTKWEDSVYNNAAEINLEREFLNYFLNKYPNFEHQFAYVKLKETLRKGGPIKYYDGIYGYIDIAEEFHKYKLK